MFKDLKQCLRKREIDLKDQKIFGRRRSKFLNSHTNETYVELFGTPWECKLRWDHSVFRRGGNFDTVTGLLLSFYHFRHDRGFTFPGWGLDAG